MRQKFAQGERPLPDLPLHNSPEQKEIRVPELLPASRKQGLKKRGARSRLPLLLLKTGAYGSMGTALVALGVSSLFFCLVIGISLWEIYFPNHDSQFNLPLWQIALNAILMLSPVIAGACVFFGAGRAANRWAVQLDEKLVTRTAADLPLSKSLLRSSAEPIHAQRDILLRSAREAQEQHEGELLRPTRG